MRELLEAGQRFGSKARRIEFDGRRHVAPVVIGNFRAAAHQIADGFQLDDHGALPVSVTDSTYVTHRDDVVFTAAARRLDGDRVALVLADQRARDRRGNGYLPLLDVRFQVPDDLISDFVAGFDVGQVDRGAEHDAVAGIERRDVDQLAMRQHELQLTNAAFD